MRVLTKLACAPPLISNSAKERKAAMTLLIPLKDHYEHIEEQGSSSIDRSELYSFPQVVREETEA